MSYQIYENYSLKAFNTFAIDVKARYFVEIHSVAELLEVLKDKRIQGLTHFILGGGSNILLTKDIPGVVIRIDIEEVKVINESESTVTVCAGSGVNWHEFVTYCVDKGWGGLENLSFIPGALGGAPVQNIGAYGVEVKESISAVEAIELATGKLRTFTNAECEFGYRDSVFKRSLKGKYVITRVFFELHKAPHTLNTSYGAIEEELAKFDKDKSEWNIKDVSRAVISIRKAKLPDPAVIGTAGSFFKNPIVTRDKLKELQINYPKVPFYEVDALTVKIPAGWLIETAGWKGWSDPEEKYGVHKQHALVLVNYTDAKGSDILDLAEKIQTSIEKNFGITIEPEVNIH